MTFLHARKNVLIRQTARVALTLGTFFIDSTAVATILAGIDRTACFAPPLPQDNPSQGVVKKLEALADIPEQKNEKRSARPFAESPRVINEGILRKTNLDELWEQREDADYLLRVTRSKFLAARKRVTETPDSKEAKEKLELARREYGAACAASRAAHEIYSLKMIKYGQLPEKQMKTAHNHTPGLSQTGYI